MLFKNYSEIKYNFNGKEINILDIFRNVSFVNVDTSKAFEDYYIQEGETPEIISAKIYGNTSYSWIVMLANSKSLLKKDWFVSSSEYERYKEEVFGGDAAYISALPDIQQGDVFAKVVSYGTTEATSVDNTAYRHIVDFDPYLRKIHGVSGGGTFASGDYIVFARFNPEDGTVTPIQFLNGSNPPVLVDYTRLLFIEPYYDSLSYLYNSNNIVVDPYRTSGSGVTGINSDTIYLNTNDTTTKNNFAKCLLYKYGQSGGPPETGLFAKTIGEIDYDKYLDKQKIKILKPEYLSVVLSALETALASNEIGKKLKIEI